MIPGQTVRSTAMSSEAMRARRDRKYVRLMDSANRIHFIYAIYDEGGQCLYVGRSVDPVSRWRAHELNPKAEWTDQAAHFRKFGPLPYDVAIRLEREAIEVNQPLHNRMFTIAHGWQPKTQGAAS